MITDISRRILLKQFNSSGRYFVDFDNLFKDEFNTITNINGDNDTH